MDPPRHQQRQTLPPRPGIHLLLRRKKELTACTHSNPFYTFEQLPNKLLLAIGNSCTIVMPRYSEVWLTLTSTLTTRAKLKRSRASSTFASALACTLAESATAPITTTAAISCLKRSSTTPSTNTSWATGAKCRSASTAAKFPFAIMAGAFRWAKSSIAFRRSTRAPNTTTTCSSSALASTASAPRRSTRYQNISSSAAIATANFSRRNSNRANSSTKRKARRREPHGHPRSIRSRSRDL